jgi:hypothetical protein
VSASLAKQKNAKNAMISVRSDQPWTPKETDPMTARARTRTIRNQIRNRIHVTLDRAALLAVDLLPFVDADIEPGGRVHLFVPWHSKQSRPVQFMARTANRALSIVRMLALCSLVVVTAHAGRALADPGGPSGPEATAKRQGIRGDGTAHTAADTKEALRLFADGKTEAALRLLSDELRDQQLTL